jgi:hypothetical protein
MQFSAATEKAEFERLDAAYRDAWTQLVLKVDYWQRLLAAKQINGLEEQQARIAVSEAEKRYRLSRNMLAEYWLRYLPGKCPPAALTERIQLSRAGCAGG